MEHNYRIALVGNPNCGKTTIFNLLTGAHQHVGNYSGVTVEEVSGYCQLRDARVELIDLPGVYGLSAGSPEERVAFKELTRGDVDLILNVIDASNAQRNLYLTTQVAELEIPMILAFNMIDDAQTHGLEFDFSKISAFFGAPVVPTAGSSGKGIAELKQQMYTSILKLPKKPPVKPKYGPKIDAAICELSEAIKEICPEDLRHLPPRCIAIKLLENDPDWSTRPEFSNLCRLAIEWKGKITNRNGIASDSLMADYRYGVVAGACREAITVKDDGRRHISEMIDKIVLNRFLGIPIFLLTMYLVFVFSFSLGAYPTEWLEWLIGFISTAINQLWPTGHAELLRRLIVEGVISGVGGVIIFLPNILMLFAAIAFLEGTGYMSRAAFVMDGFMHLFGLHGKSFIPMLLGFGCSVPAIMATRTIESERDRITTILVLPFMSCGARLPIYALIIPAFFSSKYQGLVMWLMYVLGTVVALGGARLLKSTLFKGGEEVFVMELPPYRMPTFRSILIQMWERAVMFLKKAGTLILWASILLFILNTFPMKKNFVKNYELESQKIEQSNADENEKKLALSKLEVEKKYELLEYSIAGRIGKSLEPVMKFAGFDWRVSSALLGALAGKEIFVSQLGVLFSISDSSEQEYQLQQQLRQNYTPLQAFCIMLFCLLSIPCIATLAIVRRETNSWKYPIMQMIGFTMTAWLISSLIYQAGLPLVRVWNGM